MARQCHLIPAPSASHADETLRLRFNGKPEMVVAYFRSHAEKFAATWRNWALRSLTELRGWYDRLETNPVSTRCSSSRLQPARVVPQQTPVPESSGAEVEELLQQAHSQATTPTLINNFHRSIGSISAANEWRLSIKQPGLAAFCPRISGTAGQSFGAFLSEGLSLNLYGKQTITWARACPVVSITHPRQPQRLQARDVLAGNTFCTRRHFGGAGIYRRSRLQRLPRPQQRAPVVAVTASMAGDHI